MTLAFRALSVSALILAMAAPAAAQYHRPHDDRAYGKPTGYTENCQRIQRDQQVGGALIGGVLGGLAGYGLAGNPGVEEEGALLGAVVGAVAGSQFGKSGTNCNPRVYGGNARTIAHKPPSRYNDYARAPLGDRDLRGAPAPYRHAPTTTYPAPTTSYPAPTSGQPVPAAKECEEVKRVTRLPDGREIHEPVTACREAYYGDWGVAHDPWR